MFVRVGGHQCLAEQRLRIVLLELQRLREQVRGIVLLMLLQHHPAVARFDVGVVRKLQLERLENLIRVNIAARVPQGLRLLQRLPGSRKNKKQPGSAEPQDLSLNHFSSASWTLASSSSNAVNCFLYSAAFIAAFSYFSLSMEFSSCSF